MSEVISFRLDANNPREEEALQVLACRQEQGYSIRHILTEALLALTKAEPDHTVKSQLTEILAAMNRISDQLEGQARSDVQFIGQPEIRPSTLSDTFVFSVKSAARPGLILDS